jgi:hypothetical protein
VERHGNTILRAKYKKVKEEPDLYGLVLPPSGPSFLLKTVPKVDGDGWDVLQITVGGCPGWGCIDYQSFERKAVDVRIKGPIVLDTGKVIPVNEILYATYGSSQWCLPWGQTFHDYLAE